MEAKDLMIGDYVHNHRNWECPIVEIHKDSAVVIARHYGEEEFLLSDLRPILLIPEIIEKNGFKSRKDGYDIGIPLLYWDKYCTAICGWTHCGDIIEVFDCRYVHQLQHALRLCGINKEIKL